MEKFGLVISAIYLLIILVLKVNTFNVSPQPNYVLKEPKLLTYQNKYESSFFGYSLNLRKNTLMVGAPRTQSNLASQKENNQTGAVYRCNINNKSCTPYYLDQLGDINVQNGLYEYSKLRKNNQWLGAVMDGHGSDNDSFVVCAPNIITDVPVNNYLFHGVCYKVPNTIGEQPSSVDVLAPLRMMAKQQIQSKYYYMFGQQGFSVHMSDNSSELLVGAPGLLTWKGSVVRYTTKVDEDMGGLSRRNLDKPHSIKRRHNMAYDIHVLNPSYWKQANDSYFGYAVTSGYFDGNDSKKILYVASAPQGNFQTGEVYIFDYEDIRNEAQEKTIKIYKKFFGKQMGEYFGYSLLAEDFNDDGLVDLVISAPMHSKKLSYDNGQVYIYQNKGNRYFDEQTTLSADNLMNGRFGTSLGKIGDINLDGFNDLAVGAPFEGNGAVYIFLGSGNGILSKPSQRIAAANHPQSPFGGSHMFGMSISRGVDIDNNKFNDIAIGAPNVEVAYIYRSYPVVKIISSISSLSPAIGINETQFTLRSCMRYDSNTDISFNIELLRNIKLDTQLGRAKFAKSEKNEEESIVVATRNYQCIEAPVILKYSIADIFKPITLELSHDLITKIPDSSNFCDNCVTINPNDRKIVQDKVVFSTGCKTSTCMADLKLSSSIVGGKLPYIIGSTKSISIEYKVENLGETAYLPQITVTIPNYINFFKHPSECKLEQLSLICDLSKGAPLFSGEKATVVIAIDSSKLDGKELVIRAEAKSSGDELTANDNILDDIIPLEEFSEIEIHGKSSSPSVSVEEIGLVMHNITHEFEIRNLGPSNIKQMKIIVAIPLIYLKSFTNAQYHLINFEDVEVNGNYNNRELEIVWSQNNKIVKQNRIEGSNSPPVVEHIHGMEYDTSRVGLEYDLNGNNPNNNHENNDDDNILQSHRGRRFGHYKENETKFNKYTQKITHEHGISRRSVSIEHDPTFKNLPINRTLQFNCDNKDEFTCAKGSIEIHDFKAEDNPIKISISFSIDLSKVDMLYTEERDIFVLITPSEIVKLDDAEGKTMKIMNFNPYSVITKYIKSTTPIWVYIVSAIIGILLLILMTYGLYKMGFFQRTKKEEMERLTRQSKIQDDNETEDDD